MAAKKSRGFRHRSGNTIIDSLAAEESAALLAHATRVELDAAQVLYRPGGRRFRYVFFPIDCIIAIVHEMQNGMQAEFSSIGCHGMTGARAILGLDRPSRTAICTIAGSAYRVSLSAFMELVKKSRALRDKILRYNAAVMINIGQYSLCNRFHTPDQRCARWLSFAHEGTHRESLEVTHEFLGQLLGMMRPAVSVALGVLQKRGAIAIGRGKIRIRNPAKLNAAACECYDLMTAEFKKLN